LFFCKKSQVYQDLFINEAKLALFSPDFECEQLQQYLDSFQKIAHGAKDGGPIAQFDILRFRWLTALRSSAIQTSRPHPGLCDDLEQTINRLFGEMVL
jgi:hypothetical protein